MIPMFQIHLFAEVEESRIVNEPNYKQVLCIIFVVLAATLYEIIVLHCRCSFSAHMMSCPPLPGALTSVVGYSVNGYHSVVNYGRLD